jgi:hypothetical protein
MVATVAILSFLAARTLGQPAPKLTSTDDKPPLKKEELEQLLAPIALFPDALLTQMLMASTYPLEVVQAERWVKAHKGLTGDALAKELEPLNWDPSVKSMVNFPEQLSVMSDKLDLTLKIGNAFIEQQADVLNTIQVLRNRAEANGNLKSNEKQKITVQAAAATSNATSQVVTVVQPPPQIITVESTSPDVVYVPSYNPAYVYGGWPYPAYPPYYYYPPGYYYGSNLVSFGVGVAFGAAWGYAWGNCNWGSADIDIDVDRNIDRNRNINRDQARQNMQNRQTGRQDNRGNRQGNRQSWQHDPSHRRGAAYRDTRTADRFGGAGSSRQAAQAREQFRGRAESAFGDSSRGGGQMRSMDSGSRVGSGGAGAGGAGQNRGTAGGGGAGGTGGAGRAAGVGRVGTSGGSAGGYSGTRGGTFSGVDRGGGGARQEAARGRSSGGYGGSRGGGGGGARGGGRGGGGGRR